MKYYNDSLKESESYQDDFQTDNSSFRADVSYEIKKNTENIVSLTLYFYKYSGGAHGYYEYVPYNIDMRNGDIVNLQDIFKEKYDYKSVINHEIERQIEEIEKEQNAQGVYDFKSISENQKFYIKDGSLIIFFDLYEISPYAAGVPEFNIDINKFDGNINKSYIILFQ